MRAVYIQEYQRVYNKICAKQDFTHDFPNSYGRYIVSNKNVYTGKNPSKEFGLIGKISEIINGDDSTTYDSIGGWLDPDTGEYHVDLNLHLSELKIAIMLANSNNQKSIYDNELKQVIWI